MKVSKVFGNTYMSAEHVTPQGDTYTIAAVVEEAVGTDQRHVIYFDDCDMGLPLNKTNALAIAELHGDETNEWRGKQITLYRSSTFFQGRNTPCIRARA